MKGLLFTADDESGRYHDLLVYNRKLTDKELSDYELDYIGEGKMNPTKVPHHKIKNGFGGDKFKIRRKQCRR